MVDGEFDTKLHDMESVVPDDMIWPALNAKADPTLAATDTLALTAFTIRQTG